MGFDDFLVNPTLQASPKKVWILQASSDHRKKSRKRGKKAKEEQRERSKACKTLTVLSKELFFSL